MTFCTGTFSPGWVNPNDFGDPATILLESDFRVKRLKISSGWTGMKMDSQSSARVHVLKFWRAYIKLTKGPCPELMQK